jgi:hypothetical protein
LTGVASLSRAGRGNPRPRDRAYATSARLQPMRESGLIFSSRIRRSVDDLSTAGCLPAS